MWSKESKWLLKNFPRASRFFTVLIIILIMVKTQPWVQNIRPEFQVIVFIYVKFNAPLKGQYVKFKAPLKGKTQKF